jgi:hypothetical protein
MTITSVVKDVCAAVGVQIPQSLFTNITGNRTMQEMLSLANEMALRIAYDTRDWVKLRKVQTLTGDGTTTSFPLPADFKRMLLTTNVWRSTSTMHSMRFVPDLDEWLNRRARAIYSPYGEWTIIGTQLYISPTMGSSVTAYYPYLHKNCVTLNSGGLGEAFVNDSDSFALDERLLKLGMIWQWKAQKGSPYAEDMGTYSDALSMISGHDTPAPIIINRMPILAGSSVAYPWPVPQ